MDSIIQRITSATALFLVLAIGLLYVPVGLAAPERESSAPLFLPQQATAVLTTAGNRPVTVNGSSAVTGATIMTGVTIETPDQVGASMTLPSHFSLDIAPRAKVSVEFISNDIKVNLIHGCVVLHTVKGTTGEIDTSRGVVGRADGSQDSRIEVCDPSIATAPAAAGGGLSTGAKIAIVAVVIGVVVLIPILTGGGNPSPSRP